MTLKYLITGGCGFVGRNIIALLLERGHPAEAIKVYDDLSVGTLEYLSEVSKWNETGAGWSQVTGQAAFVKGDVRDVALTREISKGADVIIHLAGSTGVVPAIEDPHNDCTSNVVGTLNMLEAARHEKVGRFVYSSSGAPLGDQGPPIHEELKPAPISPYGASKLACEGYCHAYAKCFGVETVALRFGNIYGPLGGHKISLVAAFITNALNGKPIEVHGDGTSTRDYIYTKDLANAILLASTKPGIGGEVFQIATGEEQSVNEMTDRLLGLFEKNNVKNVEVMRTAPRPSDIKRSFADTTKAKNILGWQPQYTLAEGLQETLSAYLATRK